jgi:hypothetical protein
VLEHDPLIRFSDNILLNFSYPHFSPLLLAPLAKKAGGYGACGDVFRNTADADYQSLLMAIQRGKADLEKTPRYGSPLFQPNRQYIREMKKYGALSESSDSSGELLNVFRADQAYWKTFWYDPGER